MGSITERVAAWSADLQVEALPRRVVEEAKHQMLAMIGAVHAGHFSDVGRKVSRVVKDWGSGKDATLIPSGERTTLQAAVYGNAALGLALDYDDYLFPTYPGVAAVVVPLAVAERQGAAGKDVLAAQVAANEVGARVAAATLLGPAKGRSSTVQHLLGSAVATARVLGLDAAQTRHALALAAGQPAVAVRAAAWDGEGRVLQAAALAPAGVHAAEMAGAGVLGAAEVLDGEGGLLRTLASEPLPAALGGLGQVWLTDTLSYRVYPGAAYLGPIIDSVLALVRQHHLDAKKVRRVVVAVSPQVQRQVERVAPFLRGPDSNASTVAGDIAYNVAAALADRELSPRQLASTRIADAAVWELAARVEIVADEELGRPMREQTLVKSIAEGDGVRRRLDLASAELGTFKRFFGARVQIETEGGRSFEMAQEVAYGSGGRAFDDRRKAAEDKFRRETRYTLRKERMEKAVDLIHHLEGANQAQVRELVRLVCSERR